MTRSWLLYFRRNQEEPREIPWERAALDAREAGLLIPSLQQFQLGEGASGLHFLALGKQHAQASGDWDFVEALALFIAEEQRHSGMLARYLRAVGAGVRRKHWIDGVFRKLRKLAGLECMVTVLVTAEIMAVPYYRSLLRVTGCPALRAICRRILREEAQHLQFQRSTLEALHARRPLWWIALTQLAHEGFLLGTCATVWWSHGAILRRAGMSWRGLTRECRGLLRQVRGVDAVAGRELRLAGGTLEE